MPGEGTYNKANDNLSGSADATGRASGVLGRGMTPNADKRLQEINSTNIGNLDSLFQQDPQMWQTWSDLKQEMATAEQAGHPYPLDFLPYILESILGNSAAGSPSSRPPIENQRHPWSDIWASSPEQDVAPHGLDPSLRRAALQREMEAAGVAGHDHNVPSLSDEVGPAEVTDEANSDLSLEGLVKRLFGKTKSFR